MSILSRLKKDKKKYSVGDEIKTVGGVIGKIIEIKPRYVTILTEERTKLQFVHNAIASVNGVSISMTEGADSAR